MGIEIIILAGIAIVFSFFQFFERLFFCWVVWLVLDGTTSIHPAIIIAICIVIFLALGAIKRSSDVAYYIISALSSIVYAAMIYMSLVEGQPDIDIWWRLLTIALSFGVPMGLHYIRRLIDTDTSNVVFIFW